MNENVRSNGFSRLTTEVVTTNFIYTGVDNEPNYSLGITIYG